MSKNDHVQLVDDFVDNHVREAAGATDASGQFPRETIAAFLATPLAGLVIGTDAGGLGGGHRQAAEVVERIARACGSTAMIICMHLCGSFVIDRHGRKEDREAIAKGKHLSTLAFSERGSRSQFWAPVGTATRHGDEVQLDAHKSWITSSHHATAYVWSSRPTQGDGPSSIWLVPRDAKGLTIHDGFDGLGLRGNDSTPVAADGVRVPATNLLGEDGKGLDVMLGTVLPLFNVLTASVGLGLATAATRATAEHAQRTRFAHTDSALRDLPTIRAYLARMQIEADLVRSLLGDTLTALETGREDAQLRVLQIKAAAGECATRVTELAMRVCGGAAFRRDVGVERFFRDARAGTVMAPTTDHLYDFIGKALTGMDVF